MLISAIVVLVFTTLAGLLLGILAPWLGGLILLWGVAGLLFAVLVIVGAVLIGSGRSFEVKAGSVLVIVFSTLSVFTNTGGFLVGFVLGLIGGILGLTWSPPKREQLLAGRPV